MREREQESIVAGQTARSIMFNSDVLSTSEQFEYRIEHRRVWDSIFSNS